MRGKRIIEAFVAHPNMEIILIDYSASERLVRIVQKGKVLLEKRCAPHSTFEVLRSHFKD